MFHWFGLPNFLHFSLMTTMKIISALNALKAIDAKLCMNQTLITAHASQLHHLTIVLSPGEYVLWESRFILTGCFARRHQLQYIAEPLLAPTAPKTPNCNVCQVHDFQKIVQQCFILTSNFNKSMDISIETDTLNFYGICSITTFLLQYSTTHFSPPISDKNCDISTPPPSSSNDQRRMTQSNKVKLSSNFLLFNILTTESHVN